MRSSIFHSDRSGTGWSAGDNRWSQLFRWPGKSSNRPGPKNCAAHQKYSMDEKKKEGEKKKKKAPVITRSHHCDRSSIFTNFFETMAPLPGDRGFPLWRQFWPNICRTKWKSRIHPVPIDRFFISFSSSFYHRPSPSYFHKSTTRCSKVYFFNFHTTSIIYSPVIYIFFSKWNYVFWIFNNVSFDEEVTSDFGDTRNGFNTFWEISGREILDRSECETVLEMTVTWLGTMARFVQDNSQFEICRLTINLKFKVWSSMFQVTSLKSEIDIHGQTFNFPRDMAIYIIRVNFFLTH